MCKQVHYSIQYSNIQFNINYME